MHACLAGFCEVATLLLAGGASVDERDEVAVLLLYEMTLMIDTFLVCSTITLRSSMSAVRMVVQR